DLRKGFLMRGPGELRDGRGAGGRGAVLVGRLEALERVLGLLVVARRQRQQKNRVEHRLPPDSLRSYVARAAGKVRIHENPCPPPLGRYEPLFFSPHRSHSSCTCTDTHL